MKDFLINLVLLGALQGFIICILLFRRKGNKLSDRLLAWVILLMAMASINLYFDNTGIFEKTTVLRIIAAVVPLVIIMPLGPLIYFYIRAVLDPAFQLRKIYRLQLYTAIIDIVPEVAAIIFIVGVYSGIIAYNPYPWGLFIDEYNKYADIPRWLCVTIYVWLSYKYIRDEKAKKNVMEAGRMARLKWLQHFITVFLVFQVIWLIYLVPYIHPAYSNWLLNHLDCYVLHQ
jgi:hypothetical protein